MKATSSETQIQNNGYSSYARALSRVSDKDYNRFLEISLGSSFEMETQMLIVSAINYGNPVLRDSILKDMDEGTENAYELINTLKK